MKRNEARGDSYVAYVYVAYVEGLRKQPTAIQLRAHLQSTIPAYMPSAFVCLDRNKLTDNLY